MYSIVQFFEKFFLGTALRATPVFGQIFEGCAGGDVALIVALLGIIDIFGTGAFIA
jgi:hypothetical protein